MTTPDTATSSARPTPIDAGSHVALLRIAARAEQAAMLGATARVADALDELDSSLSDHLSTEQRDLDHLPIAAKEVIQHGHQLLVGHLARVKASLHRSEVADPHVRKEVLSFCHRLRRQARIENATRWDAVQRGLVPAPR